MSKARSPIPEESHIADIEELIQSSLSRLQTKDLIAHALEGLPLPPDVSILRGHRRHIPRLDRVRRRLNEASGRQTP